MGWTDRMVGGCDEGTDGGRRRIGITAIGYWGASVSGKWWVPPLSSVLQGAWIVYVLMQKNNHNTLHTHLNYNIVQDSTQITYVIILLLKCTKKELAETFWLKNWRFPLLHNGTSGKYAKMLDFWKNYRPISVGELDSYYVNIWEININIILPWSPFKHLAHLSL